MGKKKNRRNKVQVLDFAQASQDQAIIQDASKAELQPDEAADAEAEVIVLDEPVVDPEPEQELEVIEIIEDATEEPEHAAEAEPAPVEAEAPAEVEDKTTEPEAEKSGEAEDSQEPHIVETIIADDAPVEHRDESAEAPATVDDTLQRDEQPIDEAEHAAAEVTQAETEPESEEAEIKETTSDETATTEDSAETIITIPEDVPAPKTVEQPKDVDIETTEELIEKLQDDGAPIEDITEVPDKALSEAGVGEDARADDDTVAIDEPALEAEESSKETAADAVKEDDAAGEEHNDASAANKSDDNPLSEAAAVPEEAGDPEEGVVAPEEADKEADVAAEAATADEPPTEPAEGQDDTTMDAKVDAPADNGDKPEETPGEDEKLAEDAATPAEVIEEEPAPLADVSPAQDTPEKSASAEEKAAADEIVVVGGEDEVEKLVDGAAEAPAKEATVDEVSPEEAPAEDRIEEVLVAEEAPVEEPPAEEVAAVDEPTAERGDEKSPPTSPRATKSKRRKSRSDDRPYFWERERQMSVMNGHKARLDRKKQEKGLFVNTFGKAVDRAKEDQAVRHESPEYLKKQEERRQRHEDRDTRHREERKLEKEAEQYRREIHEQAEAERRRRKEDEKEAARVAAMAEKEKELKYLRELAQRKDRRTSFGEASEGHSSSGSRRPALLKRVTSGESDTGRGLLLMVNPNRRTTSKAREIPRSEPVKVEHREHRRRQHTEDGSGSSNGSGKDKAAERPTHSRHHSSRSARNRSPPPSPVMKLARAMTKILA